MITGLGLLTPGLVRAQSTFTMLVNPAAPSVCSNGLGTTWVDINPINGATNSVLLTAPFSGSNWVLDGFAPNGLISGRSFMRVYFLPNASGNIQIPVTGQDTSTGFMRFGTARFAVTRTPPEGLLTALLSPEPAGLASPPPQDPPEPLDINWHPLFSWTDNLLESYEIELTEGPDVLESDIISETKIRFPDALEPNTEYSFSTRGFNQCGSATTDVVEFTTAQACFYVDQAIPDGTSMLLNSGTVTGNVAENLRVTLSIEHPRVSDLRVSLLRLDRAGVLIDQPGLPGSGCNRNGIEAVLRDDAPRSNETECAPEGPAVTGQLLPSQSLAAFEGVVATGGWTLVVEDLVGGQSGRLVEWCLSSGNAPGDTGFVVDLENQLFSDGFEG
ncbi:MAG: hypothetical protein KDI37_05620 [Xanthomonadales bacterium]|nr:hypothetical protein [Xanthomonadales bacterium]